MALVNSYKLSQTYKNEYLTWRNDKELSAAKRQEYLRRNPDAIKDYDREILEKMIQEETNTLQVMAEYWRVNQPWTYTKHRMKIDTYKMLMQYHDHLEEEREKNES